MREPADTCPDIDEVQEELAVIAHALHDLADKLYWRSYGKDMMMRLEDLRKQNERLRKWGRYWKDKATS